MGLWLRHLVLGSSDFVVEEYVAFEFNVRLSVLLGLLNSYMIYTIAMA